jgi:hypothetical protein
MVHTQTTGARRLPKRITCSSKVTVVVGIRYWDGAKCEDEDNRLQHVGPRDGVEPSEILAHKNDRCENPRRDVAV